MPSAQKPAGAEDAERALSREQPVAADAAAPTPANQGSASAEGVEFIEEDLQQDPPGNGDLLAAQQRTLDAPASRRAATVDSTGQQPQRHHMALRSQVSVGGVMHAMCSAWQWVVLATRFATFGAVSGSEWFAE